MHLSTAGWVIVIVFVVFVLSLNLNLVFALRKKRQEGDWLDKIQKANRSAGNPWKAEEQSYEKLARKVEEIKSARSPEDQKPIG